MINNPQLLKERTAKISFILAYISPYMAFFTEDLYWFYFAEFFSLAFIALLGTLILKKDKVPKEQNKAYLMLLIIGVLIGLNKLGLYNAYVAFPLATYAIILRRIAFVCFLVPVALFLFTFYINKKKEAIYKPVYSFLLLITSLSALLHLTLWYLLRIAPI